MEAVKYYMIMKFYSYKADNNCMCIWILLYMYMEVSFIVCLHCGLYYGNFTIPLLNVQRFIACSNSTSCSNKSESN